MFFIVGIFCYTVATGPQELRHTTQHVSKLWVLQYKIEDWHRTMNDENFGLVANLVAKIRNSIIVHVQ